MNRHQGGEGSLQRARADWKLQLSEWADRHPKIRPFLAYNPRQIATGLVLGQIMIFIVGRTHPPAWLGMLSAFALGLSSNALAPVIHVAAGNLIFRALNLLLPADRADELLGDLAERYGAKLARLGKTEADRWYFRQVYLSSWPLLLAAIKRTVRMYRRTI
jgi:hypothetical protein